MVSIHSRGRVSGQLRTAHPPALYDYTARAKRFQRSLHRAHFQSNRSVGKHRCREKVGHIARNGRPQSASRMPPIAQRRCHFGDHSRPQVRFACAGWFGQRNRYGRRLRHHQSERKGCQPVGLLRNTQPYGRSAGHAHERRLATRQLHQLRSSGKLLHVFQS